MHTNIDLFQITLSDLFKSCCFVFCIVFSFWSDFKAGDIFKQSCTCSLNLFSVFFHDRGSVLSKKPSKLLIMYFIKKVQIGLYNSESVITRS